MSDVKIIFEREGVDGIVAVDSLLADAARRFGIRFSDCVPAKKEHKCSVVVSSGSDILSPITETEKEHFAANGRSSNDRLACEARITKPGELIIMTNQKPEESKKTESASSFQDEFNALPLDKKFANLWQMEVATLNDAFTYFADSSMKAFEKVGDAISDFGTKIETEAKKATSHAGPAPKRRKASTVKPKTDVRQKSNAPRTPKP